MTRTPKNLLIAAVLAATGTLADGAFLEDLALLLHFLGLLLAHGATQQVSAAIKK